MIETWLYDETIDIVIKTNDPYWRLSWQNVLSSRNMVVPTYLTW